MRSLRRGVSALLPGSWEPIPEDHWSRDPLTYSSQLTLPRPPSEVKGISVSAISGTRVNQRTTYNQSTIGSAVGGVDRGAILSLLAAAFNKSTLSEEAEDIM